SDSGGSGSYTVRTRFGGRRTVSGGGAGLEAAQPLFLAACVALGLWCASVLDRYRRAVDAEGGAPDNVPVPATPER
ncbi:MAG: hypothetical protein K2W96_03555, partial [Gemmataceae bacterium]|nr:hypothetical protein [Gemmataceae bacterium]